MNNVYDETKFLMKKYNITANKSLGQNFLVDDESIEKIVEASDLTTDDLVIEIGPGLGSLTEILIKRAKKVMSFEIDKDLIPILNHNLGQYDNSVCHAPGFREHITGYTTFILLTYDFFHCVMSCRLSFEELSCFNSTFGKYTL